LASLVSMLRGVSIKDRVTPASLGLSAPASLVP
jgi:hypothetical protein